MPDAPISLLLQMLLLAGAAVMFACYLALALTPGLVGVIGIRLVAGAAEAAFVVGAYTVIADIDGGRMDGFIAQAEQGRRGCANVNDPTCSQGAAPDVMGWHDAREIPNYWAYAQHFVLQDHMFEPNASWSLPAHLFMVSEWSAKCSIPGDPMSCVNALQNPARPPDAGERPLIRGSKSVNAGLPATAATPAIEEDIPEPTHDCSNCGREVPDSARFCRMCGHVQG